MGPGELANFSVQSSPIRAFIMDCLEIIPDGYVVKKELYGAFAKYCRLVKLPVVSQSTFFQNLPKFATVQDVQKDIQGKRPRCFVGILLKPEDAWRKDQKTLEMEND